MLQAQARAEDQAVQLHEKLEAKRAATHAEKVRVLDSEFVLCFHHQQANNMGLGLCQYSLYKRPPVEYSSKSTMANACDEDHQLPDVLTSLFCTLPSCCPHTCANPDVHICLRLSLCNCLAVQATCRNDMCQVSA